MMTTLHTPKKDMEAKCPLCKNKVKALKLSYKDIEPFNSIPTKTVHTLGCPECNNVFYIIKDRRRIV